MKYMAVVFTILISMFLAIFFIVRHPAGGSVQSAKTINVDSYENENAILSVLVEGRLVGEEQHRAIRISVSPNERRIDMLTGYENNLESSQSYPNTREAYINFLKAVGRLGFVRGKHSSVDDPRGVCPTGQRYTYALENNGARESSLWATSCGKDLGTFAGSGSSIRQLFQAQIPDYGKQTSGVAL